MNSILSLTLCTVSPLPPSGFPAGLYFILLPFSWTLFLDLIYDLLRMYLMNVYSLGMPMSTCTFHSLVSPRTMLSNVFHYFNIIIVLFINFTLRNLPECNIPLSFLVLVGGSVYFLTYLTVNIIILKAFVLTPP